FNGPVELGIVPWVAGDLGTSIGTATGAALAFQYERSDRVCVCSFGDGTANRGDVHEALNLAACWRLPIVYVCQNNGWAISQPATDYLPVGVAARAAGYGIPGECVDGNDVEAAREGCDGRRSERTWSGGRVRLTDPAPRMTQTEAIIDAIAYEMRRDPRVFYIGQDVGLMGGSLQGTHGLFAEFGPHRVRDAPIS